MFCILYRLHHDETIHKKDRILTKPDAEKWIRENKRDISWYSIRNKGGRKRSETPKIYSKTLAVDLTSEEFDICKENLAKLGYSYFSVFVRDSLIKKEIRVKKRIFGDAESTKIIQQIGNNINQIAHTLNAFSKSNDRRVLADYQLFLDSFQSSFPFLIQKLLEHDSKNNCW